MYLVQIFVPLTDSAGNPQDEALFRQTEAELAQRFSAVSAFSKADGNEAGQGSEQVALCEVMAATLDQAWWSDYRVRLEERFRQPELVVRTSVVSR